jgi:hypothetical protein
LEEAMLIFFGRLSKVSQQERNILVRCSTCQGLGEYVQ